MDTAQMDLQQRIEKNWWVLLLLGVALTLFGLCLFFWPAKTSVVLVFITAWFLLVSGIIAAVGSIVERSEGWGWQFAGGVLGIIIGGVLVLNPVVGTAIAVSLQYYLLGIVALCIGAVTMISGKHTADTVGYQWSWGKFFLGLLIVILGILFLLFPVLGILTLLWTIAGFAFVGGIVTIVLAFQVKGQAGKVELEKSV